MPAQEDGHLPTQPAHFLTRPSSLHETSRGAGAALPGHSRVSRGFTFIFYQQMSAYSRPDCWVTLDKSCNLSGSQLPQAQARELEEVSPVVQSSERR